jgi:hypothetical protein
MATEWDAKDPDEVLDYHIDWTARLVSDQILTSIWEVPAGISKNSDDKTTTLTTIWVSGGTAGHAYPLTNRITTNGGRTFDLTKTLRVKAK